MSISNILMKLQTNLSQSPLQSRMKGKVDDRSLQNSMGKLLEENNCFKQLCFLGENKKGIIKAWLYQTPALIGSKTTHSTRA